MWTPRYPGRSPSLDLTRSYNSTSDSINSPFGYGWSSSYTMNVAISGTTETVTQENGSTVAFTNYVAPAGAYATLSYNSANSTYTFVNKTIESYVFNSSGQLISESDPEGYTATLSYTSGNLTTVTDPAGRTLTFTYGSNGLISTVTDPLGRVTTYGYNSSDDLISVIDPAGRTTIFGYGSGNTLTTITDPNGNMTTNVYSGSQVTSQTDPMGLETTWSYSSGITTITDPHGSVTVDRYTGGLLTQSTVASGTSTAATTYYTYDSNDDLTSTEDPNSHTVTDSYDANGNIVKAENGAGNTTNFGFNVLDEQVSTCLLYTSRCV